MPQARWPLYGVKPVVIAIIVQALRTLGKKAMREPLTIAVGLGVFALYFLQFNEIALLLAGALIVMIGANFQQFRQAGLKSLFLPLTALSAPRLIAAILFSLSVLFLLS